MQPEPPTPAEIDKKVAELFETMGLPSQRVELMLKEIEAQGQLVVDDLAPEIARRLAEAEAAQRDLVAIDSCRKPSGTSDTATDHGHEAAAGAVKTAVSDPGRDAAEKRFVDAHKSIYPPLWHAAREALINCALVREALAKEKAADAAEASMRAVNAWWRTRTAILERPIRYGLTTYKRRKVGGAKGAVTRAAESADRNRQILEDFSERIQGKDYSRAEIIKQLAAHHRVSDRTIRRLIPARTRTT